MQDPGRNPRTAERLTPLPPRGRFAPSPTGPLHFGSLIAALGSYAQALHTHGQWQVRIDDIDPPREQPGASDLILETLQRFGFVWHSLAYQRERGARYREALARLVAQNDLYTCGCSRRQIAAGAARGPHGFIYPGTCRGTPPDDAGTLRLAVGAATVTFDDQVCGPQRQALARSSGDFIVRRRGGLFAYHLACAVDDGEHSDQVVRGADLLPGTALQIFLQQRLGLATPRYAHLPVALGASGAKLSKQTFAAPLDSRAPLPQLLAAWDFLGQRKLETPASVGEFWARAGPAWSLARVPRVAAAAPHSGLAPAAD